MTSEPHALERRLALLETAPPQPSARECARYQQQISRHTAAGQEQLVSHENPNTAMTIAADRGRAYRRPRARESTRQVRDALATTLTSRARSLSPRQTVRQSGLSGATAGAPDAMTLATQFQARTSRRQGRRVAVGYQSGATPQAHGATPAQAFDHAYRRRR